LAFSFLHRPIYRPTVILSFVSLFIPLYPIIPPGLLFTFFCRRLAYKSRIYKAYSDLARLSLRGSVPEDELSPRSENPFDGFRMFPDATIKLVRHFSVKAFALEVLTWILLLMGIGLNIVFFLGIIQVLL
jgi:hypothetical protein